MSMLGQTTFSPAVSRFGDRAYLAWATVATAYAIAFLQRVSPQSISLSFMHDFSTDAAGVAMLASSYFWGYTLMQIPAGLLVDRYGVKRVVLFSMGNAVHGVAADIKRQLGRLFTGQRRVRAGAKPARRFCRPRCRSLRRRARLHRAPEACRAELLRRTVRRDVGHFAGLWLCRRRHCHDTARGCSARALAPSPV